MIAKARQGLSPYKSGARLEMGAVFIYTKNKIHQKIGGFCLAPKHTHSLNDSIQLPLKSFPQ